MKKRLLFCSFLMLFFSSVPAQETIKNPEKPLNENAGRILKLEEVLRITDQSGEFFLEYPSLESRRTGHAADRDDQIRRR